MCAFGGFENESSRAILNLLKFVNQLLRNFRQQRVTVIKTCQYQGCHKNLSSINCDDVSTLTNSMKFNVGRPANYGELIVKKSHRCNLFTVFLHCFLQTVSFVSSLQNLHRRNVIMASVMHICSPPPPFLSPSQQVRDRLSFSLLCLRVR